MKVKKVGEDEIVDGGEIFEGIPSFVSFGVMWLRGEDRNVFR
jgi:hypothetical protein